RPLPRAPSLFPSTTLFRSALRPHGDGPDLRARDGTAAGADLHEVDGVDVHRDPAPGLKRDLVDLEEGRHERLPLLDQGQLGRGPDRKSTRLNSSHQIISYA